MELMKLDFFKPREKFLVLEILPSSANGLFFGVDEDRNLVFEKFAGNVGLKKLLKSPARRIAEKRWEGKNLFAARRRVIAIADPSIATTIPIPVELERVPRLQQEKITLIELENLIAQELKKIFSGCRSEAAKRLEIDALNAVLVGAKVERESVDGKPVADAVGRAGKKISFLLELTFATRDIFENLKDFFSSPGGFFFAESPQVHLKMLAGIRPLPLHLLSESKVPLPKVPLAKGAFDLFIFQKNGGKGGNVDYPILYREKFGWSFDSILGDVAAAYAVSRAVAEDLYRTYTKGKMSEMALRHFKKVIEPATERLLKEVERAKISGCVYVDAPLALPFPLPHKHQGAVFEPLPLEEILNKFGFTLRGEKIPAGGEGGRHLAAFLEAYFDKSRSEINQRLRKKLHWLAE